MTDQSNDLPKDASVAPSSNIREDLVATAVKFLQNPKVQTSPLEQKKEFLKKKGLSNEEIDQAVQLSGVTTNVASQPPVITQNPGLPSHTTPVVQQPAASGWSRIREYSALTIIIAGVVYGLYTLYKNYIEPVFLRQNKERDEKLNRVEKSIQELNTGVKENMQELQRTVNTLREQVQEQNSKLLSVSTNLSLYKDSVSNSDSTVSFRELQAGINSVKGLLLSTKQFPATPVVPPVIPSWQMKPQNIPAATEQQTSSGDGPSVGKAESSGNRLNGSDVVENNAAFSSDAKKSPRRIDLEQSEEDSATEYDPPERMDPFMVGDANELKATLLNGSADQSVGSDNETGKNPTIVNGGILPNLSGSMLVSPSKRDSLAHSTDSRPIGGESELD